jgi:hypothetical protein
MVKRYLKSQLWVLLCGGLVGPIYLIVYYKFLSPDARQYVGWLYWAGWAITAVDVLIALALTRFRTRSAAKSVAMELDGVLALAQITGMAETGMSINDQPVVKLSLHIAGRGFAFDTTKRVTASVTRMGNFNARKLVVLVDPATHDYEVDWQRSALVNGLASARFTVTEDNQTYDLTGQAEPLLEILTLLKDNGIPLDGPLDLRSADPFLRQQVNDVVRRAAAARPAPAYAAGPGAIADPPGFMPPRPSAAQRLQELAGLHANEAITDTEYEERRRQIISEI